MIEARGPIVPRAAGARWMRRQLRSAYEGAWTAWHAPKVAAWRKDLERICTQSGDARARLLFAPTVPWQTLLAQRTQHMARAYARAGCLVFYAVPYHSRDCAPGFHEIEPRLHLAKLPPHVFAGRNDLTAIALTYNGDWARRAHPRRLVYEMVDDLGVFPQPRAFLEREHRRLLAQADLVVGSAAPLVDQLHLARPDAILVPNGVDADFVRRFARREAAPNDLGDWVSAQRPIIGYHGALASWFDYALVREVARLRPEYGFLLIGPDYDGSLAAARRDLPGNVRWLGGRSREDLMRYMAWYDAAMLPFVVNPLTDAISPVKLFEYLAGGKPVVSTPLAEVSRYPVVITAKGAEAFALALDHALALRSDQAHQDQLRKTADENTWQARAIAVLTALERLSPQTPGARGAA